MHALQKAHCTFQLLFNLFASIIDNGHGVNFWNDLQFLIGTKTNKVGGFNSVKKFDLYCIIVLLKYI